MSGIDQRDGSLVRGSGREGVGLPTQIPCPDWYSARTNFGKPLSGKIGFTSGLRRRFSKFQEVLDWDRGKCRATNNP